MLGAVESDADTIEKIVEEMMTTTKSERTTRVIDFDQDASMAAKDCKIVKGDLGTALRKLS